MTEKIEKNKNKKIFAIIAIIAVIAAAAAVYGIIAYFTAKDSKTNTFVVGNVSIRLDEGESRAQIQANGGNLNLEPNQEITKEPKIINTGRNAAYVYLKVRIPKAKINANDVSKSPLFTYNQNTTDWDILEEDDQTEYVERTYWYKGGNGILNAGAETGTLFNYVKLANLTWSPEGLGEIKINVNAYAIQADNLNLTSSTAKAKAQEAYQKYLDQEDDLNSATVTFYDEDGQTILGTSKVKLGTNASYTGSIPTKAGTQQYTYTFSGWDDPSKLNNVTENRSVRAVYTTTTNKYVVTFYDEDGTTQLGTSEVDYGTNASFTGSTPTKAADSSYTYEFTGWYTSLDANATEDDLSNVIANRSVYAKYTATAKPAGTQVSSMTTNEYGKYVNLGTNLLGQGTDKDWRIFYKDNQGGLYLILADYLPNSTNIASGVGLVQGTGNYATYGVISSTSRQDLLDKLNNASSWKTQIFGATPATKYANVTVKGALDLETWKNAWNERYGSTDELRISQNSKGYLIAKNANPTSYSVNLSGTTEYTESANTLFWSNKDASSAKNGRYAYWLASPSAHDGNGVMNVYCYGHVGYSDYNNPNYGVRPAVYLPSNILLEEVDGVYSIAD